jgi:phosphate transport system permease protein
VSNTNRGGPGKEYEARLALIKKGLRRRYFKERMVQALGVLAIVAALGMLAVLLATITRTGYTAFEQTQVLLSIRFDAEEIDPQGTRDPSVLSTADYGGLIKDSLREMFPEVIGRSEKRELYSLVSPGAAFELGGMVVKEPGIIGTTREVWLPANDDVDMYVKGNVNRLSEGQEAMVRTIMERGDLKKRFNTAFFTRGDSREPELAGIWGAAVGSFYTLLVTMLLSFPLGVATAVYLEEFAPVNRFTDIIEVNINNLAAVPSIVFGLLGLAVFLNFFGLPRSAPLVGGLVLTLMTLPTIIIASRATLKSVPPSIREAALGVGASKMQSVTQHVLPLAMPGILTGTIIGMARALGETAPLLMIGMVAFIVDIPSGIFDKATVLPVQIYLWADSPERAFVERTSAAILVLLAFLVVMNAAAVVLRRKFERRF